MNTTFNRFSMSVITFKRIWSGFFWYVACMTILFPGVVIAGDITSFQIRFKPYESYFMVHDGIFDKGVDEIRFKVLGVDDTSQFSDLLNEGGSENSGSFVEFYGKPIMFFSIFPEKITQQQQCDRTGKSIGVGHNDLQELKSAAIRFLLALGIGVFLIIIYEAIKTRLNS